MIMSILWMWLIGLALLFWCGWGMTQLLLPKLLQPFALLLTPLIGYCVVIWFGYQGVHLTFSLRELLPALLLITGLLNGLAWWRKRPTWNINHLRHLVYPLPLIVICTLIVGVLPALSYEYVTLIGGGWDGESYLALAAHLQDYALSELPQAAVSPLRDHVINPPVIGLSMGMSIVHGSISLLSGQSVFTTFVPYMALLRALGFVAVYVWLRATMGLTRNAASIAVALGSAGALLLWVTYFNFGMQLGGWPLITLVLALSVGAIEDLQQYGWHSWQGLALAAFAWAVVPMTYYPALTVAVPMALGLALALLVKAGPQVKLVSLGIVLMLVLVLPLSTWVVSDYLAGFAFRYANSLTTLGLFHFIPLSDVFGLTAYHQAEPQPITFIDLLGLIGIAGLLFVGLVRGPQRLRWNLTILGALVYLLWVRFGREYHYAYIKGAAYVHFALMGLVGAGWQALVTTQQRWLRYLGSGLIAGIVVLSLNAESAVIREHWNQPKLNAQPPAALDAAREQFQPFNAPIYVHPEVQWNGPGMSMIAAALYPHPLWGQLFTGYDHLDQPAQGVPTYLLLASSTTPEAQGLPPARQIWSYADLSMWQVDSAITTWQTGRQAIFESQYAHQTPAGMATLDWIGPLQMIDSGHPLSITTPIMLDLVVLTPTTLLLNQQQDISLDTGRIQLSLHPNELVSVTSQEPVGFIQAYNPLQTTPSITQAVFISQPSVAINTTTLTFNLEVANPSRHALRGELTIAENYWGGGVQSSMVIGVPFTGHVELDYDLIAATIESSTAEVLGQNLSSIAAGSYWITWSILDGESRIQRLPLGTFEVTNQQITAVQTYPSGLEYVAFSEAITQPILRDLTVGEHYVLHAASWPNTTNGFTIPFDFSWQVSDTAAPAILSIQLLDSDDNKIGQWDGPVGGWYPAGTRTVQQHIPVAIDPTTAAGDYRVLLTVYDPQTSQPVLIDGQAAILAGTITVR